MNSFSANHLSANEIHCSYCRHNDTENFDTDCYNCNSRRLLKFQHLPIWNTQLDIEEISFDNGKLRVKVKLRSMLFVIYSDFRFNWSLNYRIYQILKGSTKNFVIKFRNRTMTNFLI
jgi:DNA-directed RNA polymerase subunit RPC12/RpoP